MNTKSQTPRTDAVLGDIQVNAPHACPDRKIIDFARQLEIELNQANDALNKIKAVVAQGDDSDFPRGRYV